MEHVVNHLMVWVIVADIFGTGSGDSAARKLCNTAPSPDSSYSYYERLSTSDWSKTGGDNAYPTYPVTCGAYAIQCAGA